MSKTIPYGRQVIEEEDIDAVIQVLRSDFLTQGPVVTQFESAFKNCVNSLYATAVCNATAGLHLAYSALGLGDGDMFWTVPNTFLATANAARFLGAQVDFVDIDPDTFCLSISALEEKLKLAEKKGTLPALIAPVHFAGQPCDMKAIYALSQKYGFKIVEDAAHAVGATYDKKPIGSCQYSEAAVFSFHPVKIITTGEGGMVTVKEEKINAVIKKMLSHGITRDKSGMVTKDQGEWFYEMQMLGYNYRLTDIQAALGVMQLSRLKANLKRRREIAGRYKEAFKGLPIKWQKEEKLGESAWHLFTVLLNDTATRKRVFEQLRAKNIFVQVHYIPVHTQPYYLALGFNRGNFPNAEYYYERCLSLPMYHGLSNEEQDYVIAKIKEVL